MRGGTELGQNGGDFIALEQDDIRQKMKSELSFVSR